MKLFDKQRSEQLMLEGMEMAADNVREPLKLARNIAAEIAMLKPDRRVNADEVGSALETRYGIATLGPAAGALFKTKDWRWSGQFIKSTRITNHGRLLRIWEYVR